MSSQTSRKQMMTCAVSTKEPTQKLEHIYNDVYYGQLVIHHRDGTSPGEVEWSEFVKEARQTGPEFKSGKEKFRQAVEFLARFTKRAPQRLEQVVELWRKGDVNEALHFLGLVLTMANSTSHELEQASDIFSNVQTKLGEMMREAKGNQETMEIKSDQHSLIGALPMWETHKDGALCVNRLDYKSATLDVCKSSCWEHGQEACTHIVNYYTSTSNCYLCYGSFQKDLLKVHNSADTYVLLNNLEQANQLVQQGHVDMKLAKALQAQWSAIQIPLQQALQVVSKFLPAAKNLVSALEEVRFLMNDMSHEALGLAAQKANVVAFEHRMSDVFTAIRNLRTQAIDAFRA